MKGKARAEGISESDNAMMVAIAAASLDALITINSDGNILEFGPAAETLFGYRRDEVLGRSVAEIVIPPQLRAAHTQGMKNYFETGEGPVLNNRVEVPAIRRDGVEFAAELTVVPLKLGDEELFTAFVRDISERKQQEAELQAAREKAEQASAAKSRFLAHMSHELRSPLNAVLGATELMLDAELPPEPHLYAQTVRSSARALLGLIDEVLDFSQIESGQFTLRDEPLDLTMLMSSLADMAAVKAQGSGLEVALYVGPKVPHVVRGDPGRLRQILSNLIDNALKFTSVGGLGLSVEALDEKDGRVRLRFEVEDTGIGMDAEQQNSLFEEFAQANSGDTSSQGGVGLGLAIVQRLVAAMDGQLSVDSVPARGSVFSLELSLVVERGRHPAPALPAGRKAVVLSPNVILQKLLERQLVALGFAVSLAPDFTHLRGKQLSEADLVLADLDGLGGSVLSLIETVRSAGGNPLRVHPLVRPGRAQEVGVELGAVLFKPVQPTALGAVVYGALAQESGVGESEPGQAAPAGDALGHLLLVEDAPTNQLIATAMLKRAGYTVEVANNGHEAVEAASLQRFDAILMDLRMPLMDGLEATRLIRRLPGRAAQVPIIALTANALQEDVERCRAAGMDDYASKPIERKVLLEKLQRLQAGGGLWRQDSGESADSAGASAKA